MRGEARSSLLRISVRSISTQLALAMAFMALAAAGITGFFVFSASSDALLDQIERSVLAEIQLHAQVIDAEVADRTTAVADLASLFGDRLGLGFVASSDVGSYVGILFTNIMNSREFLQARVANLDGAAETISSKGEFSSIDLAQSRVFQAAREGQLAIGRFEVYGTGESAELALEVAQPIQSRNGELVGVLSVLVAAERFHEQLRGFSMAQASRTLLVDGQGNILLEADQGVSQAGRLFDSATDPAVRSLYQELLAARTPQARFADLEGEPHLLAVAPIAGSGWRMLVQMPQAVVTEPLAALREEAVFIGLMVLLVSAVIAFWIGRRQARGIVEVAEAMQHFAAGDLTRQVRAYGQSEIGQLARAFNEAAGRLSGLIAQVVRAASEVNTASQELAGASDGVGKATQQVNEAIQQLARGADEQARSTTQIADVARSMSTSVEGVGARAQEAAGLAQNALEAARSGRETIQSSVEKARESQETMEAVSVTVNELGAKSREIGQIVELITDIAEQTNLLALNAAIEAARAGEQGRGFAVVANEIRNLAHRSREATERITSIVEEIQSSTEDSVTSMTRGVQTVNGVVKEIELSGHTFETIFEAVQDAVRAVEAISAASSELSSGARAVLDGVENVVAVTEETAAGTEEVSSSTQEQSAAVQEISASAARLAELARRLASEVAQFKTRSDGETQEVGSFHGASERAPA